MSEKIDQIRADLEDKLRSLESSFAHAGERIKDDMQDQADAFQLIVDQTKSKIAELRSKADASAAELRGKIEQTQHDAKEDFDTRIDEFQEKYDEHFKELHRFWSNAMTDLTGGTLF